MCNCVYFWTRPLSHRFNGHLPFCTSVCRCFFGAKDDGGGSDNWSYNTCKVPVKASLPTNQHAVFLQAGCPSCRPTNSVEGLQVTCPKGHLSEGLFVRKVVVQIPKFDAKPNPKPNPNPRPNPNSNANRNLALTLTQTLTLTLCLYFSDKWPFGQVNCYRVEALKGNETRPGQE